MALTGLTTFLWFDEQAIDAAKFYVSVFPDSKMLDVSYYQEGAPKPPGTVLVASFELFGQPFAALNGGPQFQHSEAVSFQMSCDTQEEIDQIWDALIANGGEAGRCGWCKDRFGVSWQVVPSTLSQYLGNPDPEKSQRAFSAMMQMSKFVIADLG